MKKLTISKSQLEVWEWKETAYQTFKDIPKENRLKKIVNSANMVLEEYKKMKNGFVN
jgi:hypothetical protein